MKPRTAPLFAFMFLTPDLPLRYGFSVTAYYGYAWGKAVIKTIYPAGTTARFGYVETNFRF